LSHKLEEFTFFDNKGCVFYMCTTVHFHCPVSVVIYRGPGGNFTSQHELFTLTQTLTAVIIRPVILNNNIRIL